MLIQYKSCDGETIVEEEISKMEFHQNYFEPHETIIWCYRSENSPGYSKEYEVIEFDDPNDIIWVKDKSLNFIPKTS